MRYDYYEAVKEDVRNYCNEEVDLTALSISDREELEEYLNDTLWTEDSVTGNASGSYTFSSYEAEEYVMHNLDLLAEAIEEFGGDVDFLKNGVEACDVTIRCYVLSSCISEVLDEMEEELEQYFNELEENALPFQVTH